MLHEIGALFADEDFAALFPVHGQPAKTPWRLALVTIMQFIEGLSDRAAADAVRSRIDWKYALSLELTDAGFDSTVLCEFRARLVAGDAEQLVFDKLLDVCRERKWLKMRGRQRTDSTHVLAAVHASNRLECAFETLRHALNTIAVTAPEWLRDHAQPEWVDRYAPRAGDHHIPPAKEKRQAHAEMIGVDGDQLLCAVRAADAPPWLREVPAVEILRRVWLQQFYMQDGAVHWRTEVEGIPPARLIVSSPYDTDARLGRKRTTLKVWGFLLAVFLIGDVKRIGAPHIQAGAAMPQIVSDPPPAPPQFWEYALHLLLSKEDRENIIGDLAEEYAELARRFGTRRANLWYYKQVIGSAAPLARKAVRVGWFVLLGEWFRRYIS